MYPDGGGCDACDGGRRPAEKEGRRTRSVRNWSLLSVAELQERIVLLREEIARLEADIAKKQASRSTADQFFKK